MTRRQTLSQTPLRRSVSKVCVEGRCRRSVSKGSVYAPYATYAPCAPYTNIWSTFPLYSVVHSTLWTPAILSSRLRRDLHFADRVARRRRCVGGLCLRDLRAPKPGIPRKPRCIYTVSILYRDFQGLSGIFRDIWQVSQGNSASLRARNRLPSRTARFRSRLR